MRQIIFAVFLAAALGVFARTVYAMVRAARRGTRDPQSRLDRLPERIASVLIYFLGQKKVAEEGPLHRTSKHHLLIFWGFLLITIGTTEVLVAGLWPAFSLDMLMPEIAYGWLKATIDVFNLLVLLMVTWAVIRRVFFKPPLIPMNLDAGLILGGIGALMITHFLYHGFRLAGGGPVEGSVPVSGVVADWLAPVSVGAATLGAEAALWLHVAILLVFLNYLPFSKHIHLLGALPNIYTRRLDARLLDMPKLDLEDENQWGVGRFEQFSWKSLIDTYACTECARCTNYCPAYATGKNLSPMQLIHDIRYEMIDRDAVQTRIDKLERNLAGFPTERNSKSQEQQRLEEKLAAARTELEAMAPLTGGRVAEDTLWACTTCGACQEVCPVFIEHPLKILQMRQNLVLAQEKIPAELGRTFRNIERQSNPWGISNEKRMEWAEGLSVPTIEERPDPEYLLWVGCAGAFDNRIQKQTRALVKVLDAAGVDYAVLGHKEGCTGDPARRGGNELLFQMQAEANVTALNEAKAKKVITSCPHCLHTLRHDYPQFGGNYEVVHHTQLIGHLLEQKKLDVRKLDLGGVTYHDSCYLGRWNREFEAPRAVLDAVNQASGIVELRRNKRHGFCCGAGGARMFVEEESPRVNENRTAEILASGAKTVAVACPFCNIMITDGVKASNRDEDVSVLDVAELVARAIPDVPASALNRRRAAE